MDDLNVCVLRLLKFVEDSVNEALSDPSSRQALFSEADDAIRILGRTLEREDKTKLAQLMLLVFLTETLEGVASRNYLNPVENVKEALQVKMRARKLFYV